MKKPVALILLAAAALLMATMPPASSAPASQRVTYIVVLDSMSADVPAVAADAARTFNGQVGFIYQHALAGFSITIPAAAAAGLARAPGVSYVELDAEVTLAQDTPTGIDRIYASANAALDIDGADDFRVDVDVAVIDTGIDFDHPDLNVVGGVNCATGGPFGGTCSAGGDDDHYHGTHVAGTIAALDNDIGVVGVAPGARLHAVKVLNKRGSGYTSWIIGGIDWVADPANGIEVANMSLGGSGFSQAEYDAIERAVANGVAFAVSAGNSNDDAKNYSPAAFDNVLTVSALADFDGVPGGRGSSTCRTDQDDTLADFSNWGPAVDIAAPGVCILSTYPLERGEYGEISGTSMASPHVAGALALLASAPVDVQRNALDVAALYMAVISSGNDGWFDESEDDIQEPLLDVSTFSAVLIAPGNAAPVADAGPDQVLVDTDGNGAESVTLDGSGSSDDDGTIVGYTWDDGNGTLDTRSSFSVPLSVGVHTFTLTVVDDGGAQSSDQVTITVSTDAPTASSLSGSSQNNGKTWTATVTFTGDVGQSQSGTWDYDGAIGDECSVVAGATPCDISLSGIPKKVASVTYTSGNESITILKP